MQTFTPWEYLLIDLANHYGLDKETWKYRLEAGELLATDIIPDDPENPILFQKTLRTIADVRKGKGTGHLVSLDATASGLQIMSALAGCASGCKLTNLISTGQRQDIYTVFADMVGVPRGKMKKPLMTYFYGSTAEPKKILGEGEKYQRFMETLHELLPGAMAVMNIFQSLWDPTADSYSWTLPDAHTTYCPVTIKEDKKIELDELDGVTFTHRITVQQPTESGLSMAANIVHSIDGFIVRQMYELAASQGWELLTIHDSFWCHPKNVQQMRKNYNLIFADLINPDLLNSILKQFNTLEVQPLNDSLNHFFNSAEYALS